MDTFDLAVIGGGTAGLVTSAGAASLGAKVALIERDRLGGECLYTGCVPSKALIRSAKVLHLLRRAADFGLNTPEVSFDFAKVMDRMRLVQQQVGKHDSPERFRGLGVTLFSNQASFLSPTELQVGAQRIKVKKVVIATGSRTAVPPIEGLEQTGFLDHVSALALSRLPRSVVILGGGPIGLEFAQLFARFGVRVTVLEVVGQILPREDQEIAQSLEAIFRAEGIDIHTCTKAFRIEKDGAEKIVHGECTGTAKTFRAEEIFLATGRRPNVEGLNLEAAGVRYDGKGVVVDDTLRTTARNIWASGDVTGKLLFTHVAEYQARLVVRNALFPLTSKANYRVVPWCTFTDPEVARVGLTEVDAREQFGHVKVYRHSFGDLDRALCDGEAVGLTKLVCTPKGKIVGAHIMGPQAGDLIQEVVLAMRKGLPVGALSQTIHVYPTLAEGVRRAADLYYREKLFKGPLKGILQFLMRFA
ncbi:dihydrolipoyl dehydrogenase [Candidatus Methylomirabilis lanthanidiphila]|uniref:Dihydrolipoyl dehydrogenase n=1 Tax=Candidatus Methylomirabilis lanthanidiphila TaxID=2211376 RepID=A0A564ZJF9_9BACT|nr:mercuric reductase [Candidatus Methylomirabilis lanthanidiphila]VUZ85007.1 dihydrolipoyl dehydrogenase [Candidatus Methylomirabilis lanthanidiphila]